MQSYSLHEIKKELSERSASELQELCIRLARYKKENKELLMYLLFESGNEQAYIDGVKQEMDDLFLTVNSTSLYLAKKTIRKILRTVTKYNRYSGKVNTELELLIYFCSVLKKSGLAIQESKVLTNLYEQQLKKINKALATLHEDLQYDYKLEIEKIAL